MKLNYDCIRDILLFIEKTQKVNSNGYIQPITEDTLIKALSNIYSCEELIYNTQKLYEANFIDLLELKTLGGYSFQIKDITFAGHQYLNNIRNQNIWNQTKEKLKIVGGSASLSIISNLANKIISSKLGI